MEQATLFIGRRLYVGGVGRRDHAPIVHRVVEVACLRGWMSTGECSTSGRSARCSSRAAAWLPDRSRGSGRCVCSGARRGRPSLSGVEQLVVTDFIAEGHLARHVRRMRVLYEERRDALVQLVAELMGERLELADADAGLHAMGWLPPGVSDRAIEAGAERAGVEARALSPLSLGPLVRGASAWIRRLLSPRDALGAPAAGDGHGSGGGRRPRSIAGGGWELSGMGAHYISAYRSYLYHSPAYSTGV